VFSFAKSKVMVSGIIFCQDLRKEFLFNQPDISDFGNVYNFGNMCTCIYGDFVLFRLCICFLTCFFCTATE
jgi:hypothetical protein